MTNTVCGLCRKERALVESHLIPSSAYRILREPGEENPNPVIIWNGGAVATSTQIAKKFLCVECEQCFSSRGEDYVMSQCFRGHGCFPFRETLEASKPMATLKSGNRAYDLEPLPGSRIPDLIYFAVSVLWRSAATAWDVGRKRLPRVTLGPYGEQLRLFLLDKAPLPACVYLHVQALSDRDLDPSMLLPYSDRIDGCWRHTFSVPGIFFFFFIGRTADIAIKQGSLTTPGPKIVFLGGFEGSDLFRGLVGLVKKAPPRGSLEKLVEEHYE